MTYGTLGYGFFRDTVQFQRKMMYWHLIPACTELGFRCDGKSIPATMETYMGGIHIQDQMVLAAGAAEVAKGRST
jgi:hypothetical protein